MAETRQMFGLYVHWPFCLSKCPYCDFNSHVRAKIDGAAWAEGIVAEMRSLAARLDERRPADTIFFGGGTPSLMPAEALGVVLAAAREVFGLAGDAEITLEANPTSVDATRFRDYRALGVNRVSLGVQALNDSDLKALGRLHTADEALKAVALAQEVFPRQSFDLIYARPGQSAEAWEAELGRALAQGCRHYSLYQLTFEEGTPFRAALDRGTMREADAETAAAMYELTQEAASAAGLPAYEISNHAAPGEECRHNLIYWRYGDYLGVGPGAHGRVRMGGRRVAMETVKQPEAWLARVKESGAGLERCEVLSSGEQGYEALLMGLRLSEGVERARIEELLGFKLPQHRVAALQASGLIDSVDGRIAATERGRLVLNSIIRQLAA